MTNQRVSPRYETYKLAHIVLDSGKNLIRCYLRNLSASGVCVEIPQETYLPKMFSLLFEQEQMIKGPLHSALEKRMVVRMCETMWRNSSRLGARFSD